MTKLALGNMICGFGLIFLASSGGFFLAQYRLEAHLGSRPEELLSWWMMLQKSAHAHTNLFGMLHILFALTFPYSLCNKGTQVLQTVFLSAGSFAMSVLLVLRATHLPRGLYDPLGVLIGIALSTTLVALVLHMIGLSMKLHRTGRIEPRKKRY